MSNTYEASVPTGKYPKLHMDTKEASYVPEYVRLGKTPISMDTTIPSYDQSTVDEYPQVNDSHIIDNNDFVGFANPIDMIKPVRALKPKVENDTPAIGDYILMVAGKTVEFGSVDKVEDRLKSIMYGEDASFSEQEVSVDDIVVLKRLPIKIGVFVGD